MQNDIQEVFNLINKKYGSAIFEDVTKLACVLEDVAPWLNQEIHAINMIPTKNLKMQLMAETDLSRQQLQKNMLDVISQTHSENQKTLENCIYLISCILNKLSPSQDIKKKSSVLKNEGRCRKLSDAEMKQEIRVLLCNSNGLNDANICQRLSERGIDSSFFKRAVTQMVIEGDVEYRSNKLYLKGSGFLPQAKPISPINTSIQTGINKDSEEAVRKEVLRLLKANKNLGLTNTQIVNELEDRGYSTRWFNRIRTRLVIEHVAEYRGNKLFSIR